MSKHFLILTALLLMLSGLCAEHPDITAWFTPHTIHVNSFKTASFDPTTPWNQPILTNLLINNTSDTAFRFYLRLDIFWSGISEPLVTAKYISETAIPAQGQFFPLTNQDLITNQASTLFNRVGSIDFSLDEITSRSPVLREAVLAGYFPDGELSLRVMVQPESDGHENWSGASVEIFTIRVASAGAISLICPGAPAGSSPPAVDQNPVNFLWNSIDTEINQYWLTIREYPQNLPPEVNSLVNTGSVFYENYVYGNQFAEFLPFTPGNYYAWRISTNRWTELDPLVLPGPWRDDAPGLITSGWNIFQYTLFESGEDPVHRISAVLNSLKEDKLEALFNEGFRPTGEIIWQGRSYHGQSAIDLIEQLGGQKVRITVWE
ncbi:MAG: hypothetical protein PHD87_02515 [Candidatus Cloacimonetes bacterium]|nr:hypothetical protein [Candidatus Cloacimonadota bacterium]